MLKKQTQDGVPVILPKLAYAMVLSKGQFLSGMLGEASRAGGHQVTQAAYPQ